MKEHQISVVSSVYKIRREEKTFRFKKRKACLHCATNGHESVQIMVTAARDIENYSVKLLPFVGENGELPTDAFEIFVEHYAEVDRPTRNNRYIHPIGFYPDALIPITLAENKGELHIRKGDNQGIWLCFSAGDLPAGTYQGGVEITLDNQTYVVAASVNIYPCAVSETVRMQTLFIMRERFIQMGEGEVSPELVWEYFHFLLKYRLNPYTFPVRTLDVGEFADCVEKYYDNPAMAGYGFPQQWGGGGGVFNFDLLKEQIQELAKRSQKGRNLLDKAFIKNGDEPEDNKQIESLIEYENQTMAFLSSVADEIEKDESGVYDGLKANKGWKESIAAMDINVPFSQIWTTLEGAFDDEGTRAKMLRAVNTWCPKPNAFDFPYGEILHRLHDKYQQGRKLWWYICNDPVWPYPSYHIDDVLIGARLLSWMQYQHDVVGNLYWSPVCFSDNCRPHGVTKYDVPYRRGGVGCPSGEGFLFYPGKPYNHFGPLPSMRLMAIRDGMEDYELLIDYAQKIDDFCKQYSITDGDSKSVLNTYMDRIICGTQFYENVNEFDCARQAILRDLSAFDNSNVRFIKVEHSPTGGTVVCYTRNGVKPQGNFETVETVGEWTRYEGFIPYTQKTNYLRVGKQSFYLSTMRTQITDFSTPIKDEYIDVTKDGKVYTENGKTVVECPFQVAPRDLQAFTGVYFDIRAFGLDALDLSAHRYLVFEIEGPKSQTCGVELVLYTKDGYCRVLDTYVEKGKKMKFYIRTDRVEWSKLNRISGIGIGLGDKFWKAEQTIKVVLHGLSTIQ